jgi:putative nucleotidyltransferase with HDIG domain
MIVAKIPLPSTWVLNDMWVRSIGLAFVLGIVVYLADQQRRLQNRLEHSYAELADARNEIVAAYDRLAFAHRAAELMAALPGDEGLCQLLDKVTEHFDADACAVVGTDVNLYARNEEIRGAAREAVMHAAVDTVRAGTPLAFTHEQGGSSALAVPLRVNGHLRSVLCVWRQDGVLPEPLLEGLQLVARIIELSMENRALLEQTGGQLGGMVRTMLDLLERRRPASTAHAELVSRLADSIAQQMGLDSDERHSLRVAALLHDVGLLEVPESLLRVPRELSPTEREMIEKHPAFGADLATVAGLDTNVREAIRCHHERLDGSGFPAGMCSAHIPLLARILAVADDFASMTTPQAGQPALPEAQALHIMDLGAETQYDIRVVHGLQRVAARSRAPLTSTPSFDPEALLERLN